MFSNRALLHNYGTGTRTFRKCEGKINTEERVLVFLIFALFELYMYKHCFGIFAENKKEVHLLTFAFHNFRTKSKLKKNVKIVFYYVPHIFDFQIFRDSFFFNFTARNGLNRSSI